jgi:hypothetical protein
MSKKRLSKLEKWHTFCTLKGIDIGEEFYSILQITELIDRLEAEITENNHYYQAALECRRMQIDREEINWYRDHLETKFQEKEQARLEQLELENPILKSLFEKNDLKFTRESDKISECNLNLIKGKETISVRLAVVKDDNWRFQDRWTVSYSWFDQNLSETRKVSWNPRMSSIKVPSWFPDHWKHRKNISQVDHMCFFVAWRLVTGKASHMGGNPHHCKQTTSLKCIEDIKNLQLTSA